jgi:hypothetical protein
MLKINRTRRKRQIVSPVVRLTFKLCSHTFARSLSKKRPQSIWLGALRIRAADINARTMSAENVRKF